MKTYFKKTFIVLTFLFSSTLYAFDKFTFDPEHTYILWQVKHLGFSSQSGKWYATGTLLLDKNNPQNSKVEATIPMNNVVTGIPALDKHLRGKSFFDVIHFPTATFVSTKIEKTGADTGKVYGKLTIKGISKPILLNVKFNKLGINPITKKPTVGFSAHTRFNRSIFNVINYIPNISDEVNMIIEVEAYKNDKGKNDAI